MSKLGAESLLKEADKLNDLGKLEEEVKLRQLQTQQAVQKWRDKHVKCHYKAFRWLQKSLTTFSYILSSYGGIIEIVKQVEPKFGDAYSALSVFLVVSGASDGVRLDHLLLAKVIVNKTRHEEAMQDVMETVAFRLPRVSTIQKYNAQLDTAKKLGELYDKVLRVFQEATKYFLRSTTGI